MNCRAGSISFVISGCPWVNLTATNCSSKSRLVNLIRQKGFKLQADVPGYDVKGPFSSRRPLSELQP